MAVLNFDIKTVTLPSGEESKAVFLTGSIDASTNQTFEGRLTKPDEARVSVHAHDEPARAEMKRLDSRDQHEVHVALATGAVNAN